MFVPTELVAEQPLSLASDNASVCATVIDDLEAKAPMRIVAMAPSNVQNCKYLTREAYYPADSEKSRVPHISPLKTKFENSGMHGGWDRHIAPEGKPYFQAVHRPVVTMDAPDDDIEEAADSLLARLEAHDVPADTEIVLVKYTETDTGDAVMGYHLASMSARTVFWLDEVPSNLATQDVRAAVSETHLGLAVTAQFWSHVENFPNHRGIPEDAIRELRDACAHGQFDRVTSSTSTFSLTPEYLAPLWRCMDSLKADEANGYLNMIAARLLHTLYDDRFKHFYGEPGVRLASTARALEGETSSGVTSWLFAPASVVLFGLPSLYLQELDDVYCDNLVQFSDWQRFLARCQKDRADLQVPTFIMVCADIGLLALTPAECIAARTLSGVSVVLLISVYATSQVFSLYERQRKANTADAAIEYMTKWDPSDGPRYRLAIGLSIPRALFLWSLATFVAALVMDLFRSSVPATQVSVLAVLATMALIIIALLWIEVDCDDRASRGMARLWNWLTRAVRFPQRNYASNAGSVV
ncbi:hypothetical protein PsYK624_109700 [Phanerochaete sordida]|uniref:Uncharacterized protein n=1 Tax=Phanerochaete sordida TaxID=48140 RepID=A0A9P3LGR0_9APHY|nr:hypothetical protein PsYK624_109700 [Phanerochaete sordida]